MPRSVANLREIGIGSKVLAFSCGKNQNFGNNSCSFKKLFELVLGLVFLQMI
jgi:hypothetical protein